MFRIAIPLAYRNPRFERGTPLTVEVSAVFKRACPETRISWESLGAELPYLSQEGKQSLFLQIPAGECTIPRGSYMHHLIKHVVTVPDDIKESLEYPPDVMVFNKLEGIIKLNHSGIPLLKWRFIACINGNKIVSPWSYCSKAKEIPAPLQKPEQAIVPDQFTPPDQAILPEQAMPPAPAILPAHAVSSAQGPAVVQEQEPQNIEEIALISQCPKRAVTLGENLDFVIGIVNHGCHAWETLILECTFRPIPGVKLEAVSMEGAFTPDPGNTAITADKPGVFLYHFRQIPPQTEVVRHIFLKLIQAPVGSSLVSGITCLYHKNREIMCETSQVPINIAPSPGTGQLKKSILDSISREDVSIAEILSSEAERIRKATFLAQDIPGIISVNDSLQDTLKSLVKYQILLEYKMEDAFKTE